MLIGFDGRYAQGDLVGVGKYIRSLVLALSKCGITYVLFYSKRPKSEIAGATSVILNSPNRYYFEQVLLPIALIKHKVDLYHAAGNVGVPLFSPVPVVLTVHDTIPFDLKNYFADARFPVVSKLSYFLRFKLSCGLAKKIVTITKYTKDNLAKSYGVDERKIEVINSGISMVSSVSRLPRGLIKGQYIINNGGIDIRKNQERLIQAFKLTKVRFPEMKLVITGENSAIKLKLQKLAKSLGLTRDVVFTGYVKEKVLWTLIKNSACVVYPSLMEGFGTPVLEGFAAGVPVISSNTTSIPEISGGAALLVNPLDVSEIALAIRKVLSSKELSQSLVAKGKRVVRKYNWETTIDEYLNLYNHL